MKMTSCLWLGGSEGKAYQYLVTEGDGNTKWEDRLAYDDSKLVVDIGHGVQYVKVADEVPSWASVDASIKVWGSDGTNVTISPGEYIDLGNGSFTAIGAPLFTATDNFDYNGVVIPEKGVYFILMDSIYMEGVASADSDTLEITWDGNIGGIKKIDPKYIPSELNEIILPSSTSGSSKKFKITVNDNGAITATEVTT